MRYIIALALLLTLPSCAYIVEGKTQDIYVETAPECAQCTLHQDGKIIARTQCTPEMVTIKRTIKDVNLQCQKDGYAPTGVYLDSGTESWVYGNILWGPLAPLTLAVDMTSGAVNTYEQPVALPLNMALHPEPIVRNLPTPPLPFFTGESEYMQPPADVIVK